MQVIPTSGLALGFSGTDILNNSWALLGLLGTFVVLSLAPTFTLKIINTIKGAMGRGRH